MGSSHSAPRRRRDERGPTTRRPRRRISQDSATSSPSSASASFSGDFDQQPPVTTLSQRLPVNEELPSLLEEAGSNHSQRSRLDSSSGGGMDFVGNNSQQQQQQLEQPSRLTRLTGLSVIQSNRQLEEYEMNESFTLDDDAPSGGGARTDTGGPEFISPPGGMDTPTYLSATSSVGNDYAIETMTPSSDPAPDFVPQGSRNSEWMGRSIETLVLGYASAVPILCLPEDEDDQNEDLSFWGPTRRRSTVSTLGSSSEMGRRSSLQSFQEHRRGSLVGSGNMHGGTLANYYSRRRQAGDGSGPSSRRGSLSSTANRRGTASSAPLNRRGSTSHGPSYRRRLSMTRSASGDSEDGRLESRGGPNITLSLIARETTGRLSSRNRTPASKRLKQLGGHELFSTLDRPAGGMCSEVAFLSEVIDSGDWAETQTVISRIAPRLIGDPMAAAAQAQNGEREAAIDDPNLPPTAPRFYAGGGRLGLERDAFVQAGGIDVLIRIFKEPSFVGAEMAQTYDARDLTEELVAIRLAQCWNEVMASLRELVYAMPSVVENGDIFDNGGFLPFLFSLLSHDSCFDGAAALIEEILSLQSHSAPQQLGEEDNMDDSLPGYHPSVRVALPTTFFLGNVPDLYKLWNSFSCRQLAHFCRILALLVFEPEDRQLLESPAVLKSIELLQLRRNRAARAGRDSTVDLNQSILLGDENLTRKLLKLLSVMNYAPNLRRTNAYHVMAHFPFIADTLVMLGLNELTNWKEIDRLEKLARTLLSKDGDDEDEENRRHVNELGKVADMLENTSSALMANSQGGSNQLGQIIHIISVAQQHGVVPGASRRRRQSQNGEDPEAEAIDGFASATGMLTDQVMGRRSVFVQNSNSFGSEEDQAGDSLTGLPTGQNRPRINTPQDAANALQFNALLLGLYQVEVLFVLCTLLGGRRKIDSQQMLNSFGVIPVLEDMFQRLPWAATTPPQQATSSDTSQEDPEDSSITPEDEALPSGIHGPGCECTPESAFCVQYLRLLHNFCDRDCDNYGGRRLLLSDEERRFIFGENTATDAVLPKLKPGLLSKITTAFIGESDESPYRFWLASCVESYLRGSSTSEQLFVAKLGLLKHLIRDITSDFLHCAGSLQTSFDLLGELCKGNAEVIRLLVKDLDEESFRKLMSVAAANLVDSNVFIRSLLLSLERMSSSQRLMPLHLDPECFDMRQGVWKSQNGIFSRSYLTHSWWDTHMVDVDDNGAAERSRQQQNEFKRDASRSSDWFPTIGTVKAYKMRPPGTILDSFQGLHNGVGHFGWVFTPEGETLRAATHEPNTVERLSWFLASNQTRLLRDLLGVVDLKNINHENICCLNTAVVIAIFAYRRGELHSLLQDLGRLNIEEREIKRRALNAVKDDNVIDRAFVQAMKYMDLEEKVAPAPYGRRASLTRRVSLTYYGTKSEIGDKNDVMRNFREVLWFWIEYYTHRGRDRLSLEYSSHLRFQEWVEVVYLLGADDGAPTSLVSAPVRLPRSPYQRSARMPEPLTRL